MNPRILPCIFFILGVLGFGCDAWKHPEAMAQKIFPYAGLYHAIVPSASCEGLFSILTLTSDFKYDLKIKKLGVADSFETETGTFSWDASTRRLTLSGRGPESNKFYFDKGNFILLDKSGKPHQGDEAERESFVFYAYKNVLKEIKWKLVEINEKSLPPDEVYRQDPYVYFPAKDNSVQGFGGCNSFFGSARIRESGEISMTDLAATKMYCAQVSIETDFLNNLREADTFSTDQNFLTLLKGSKTLLKFKAKY
ncbi:MAG: META domain-containing protein [Flavobacteriales bacterium]|nr:META domain-containing protein [Flavobacteriales bacterium]